jgi:hypothetical protein
MRFAGLRPNYLQKTFQLESMSLVLIRVPKENRRQLHSLVNDIQEYIAVIPPVRPRLSSLQIELTFPAITLGGTSVGFDCRAPVGKPNWFQSRLSVLPQTGATSIGLRRQPGSRD